jgi:hypothetical protein
MNRWDGFHQWGKITLTAAEKCFKVRSPFTQDQEINDAGQPTASG